MLHYLCSMRKTYSLHKDGDSAKRDLKISKKLAVLDNVPCKADRTKLFFKLLMREHSSVREVAVYLNLKEQ